MFVFYISGQDSESRTPVTMSNVSTKKEYNTSSSCENFEETIPGFIRWTKKKRLGKNENITNYFGAIAASERHKLKYIYRY